jgi:gliding motility-associated-like protein
MLNLKTNTISTRIIILVFILMMSVYANAQSFIVWNDGGVGAAGSTLTSITGTFPGGTVTASNSGAGINLKLGQEYNILNLNGSNAAETFGSYGALTSGASKSLTFTFSTPVIINSFNINDIDKGGSWDDSFSFATTSFTSVVTGGGATASLTGTMTVPTDNGGGAEYANWFTSTTAVTSFTVNYHFTAGKTSAYLGYSMEVTPGQTAISIEGDTIVCLGDSVLLTAVNDSIFSWATTSSPSNILSIDSSLYVSPTTTTTYAVYGTADTAYHTVLVDTLLQPFSLGNDTSICQGETVLLSPVIPNSIPYLWQDGSNNATFLVNTDGTYWLEISNVCNTVSDSINVIVNPVPNINITTPDTLLNCVSNIPINVNLGTAPYPGYTYSWTNGITLNSSIIQNPISTPIDSLTNYLVTVTDSSGLCSDTDSIEITACCITPSISFTNSVCFGYDNGKIFASAFDPFNNLTIEFHNNDPTFTLLQTTTGNNPSDTITNLAPGSYIVLITADVGCSFSDTLTITSPNPVIISNNSPDTIICRNSSATIFATAFGDFSPINLIWDNGLITNGPHTVFPTADSTIYKVYALDVNGCPSDTHSIIVALFPPIIIDTIIIMRETICEGDTTTLKAIANGGGTDLFYTWMNGSGTIISSSNTNQIIVTPSYDGEIFTVIVADSCTTLPDTLSIITDWQNTVHPEYTVDSTVFCYDQFKPTFTNTTASSSTITNVQWDFDDGTITNLPFSFQIDHEYNTPGIYNVKLTVTDQVGCKWDTIMSAFQIDAHAYPISDFHWTPQHTDYLNAQITFNNLSSNNVFNEWLFITDAAYTSNLINPIFQFPQDQPGNYEVTLKVTNKIGCQVSTTKTITINEVFLFYIPTAFSPNGDGLNDEFKPILEGVDLSLYKMRIFNRWGELIFESNNTDIGWNGTYKGTMAQEGVYIWKIEAKETHSPIIHRKDGAITLIK